jgi:hypothetical protein
MDKAIEALQMKIEETESFMAKFQELADKYSIQAEKCRYELDELFSVYFELTGENYSAK